MRKRAAVLNRLWLPLLPVWASSLMALVLVASRVPERLSLLVAMALLTAGTGVVLGVLLAFDLPRVRLCERRAERLQAIFEVIRKAGSSLQLQEVLDTITRITVEVTRVRGCSVKLWDTDSGTMRVRSMAGIARQPADLSIDVAQNIYHRSLMEGKPVLVEGALRQDFPEVDDETESLICVPLRTEGRVLGALCVYGERGGRLSEEMISLFSILGDLVTLSIANASVYESLQRLDKAKSWFLLKASHELRTPLDAIQSMATALTQGFAGELRGHQAEMLRRIEARARTLAASVNDLLVLARGRAELATPEMQKVDLCPLVADTVQLYRAMAAEKPVSLEAHCMDDSAVVYGREDGLRSIVANLLSNAIKYTPQGGRVELRLTEQEGKLVLEVRDSGIGIPLKEQKELFQEFFRASNARAAAETGTGLGLAIVKATVEQHGGSIEVESREGQGTTFRVQLSRAGS
jgi:signal transduction histidine kinase